MLGTTSLPLQQCFVGSQPFSLPSDQLLCNRQPPFRVDDRIMREEIHAQWAACPAADFHQIQSALYERLTAIDPLTGRYCQPKQAQGFTLQDFTDASKEQVRLLKAHGVVPAIGFDVDGTLANSRAQNFVIFERWLKTFFLRQIKQATVIRDFYKQCSPRLMPTGRVDSPLTGFNNSDILTELGLPEGEAQYQAVHEDARSFHADYFFPAEKRLEFPPIAGGMNLVRYVQGLGIRTLFVTLRSSEYDMLNGHLTSTEHYLRSYDAYSEDSVVLLHNGNELEWTRAAMRSGTNERSKAGLIQTHQVEYPEILLIGFVDNAPKHANEIVKIFGAQTLVICLRTEVPPYSPQLLACVLSVYPEALEQIPGYSIKC